MPSSWSVFPSNGFSHRLNFHRKMSSSSWWRFHSLKKRYKSWIYCRLMSLASFFRLMRVSIRSRCSSFMRVCSSIWWMDSSLIACGISRMDRIKEYLSELQKKSECTMSLRGVKSVPPRLFLMGANRGRFKSNG